jgi:Bacterial regulatory helix-turn-helix protein, lysR family
MSRDPSLPETRRYELQLRETHLHSRNPSSENISCLAIFTNRRAVHRCCQVSRPSHFLIAASQINVARNEFPVKFQSGPSKINTLADASPQSFSRKCRISLAFQAKATSLDIERGRSDVLPGILPDEELPGRRMEFGHMRYLVAVAEERDVTRAAVRLRVSQLSLSRKIRDLNAELGVALFDHDAKAVRLTDPGRLFLTEARAVVQRPDEAVEAVKAVASGQRGEIRVGYALSLTVELLPCALRFFQEANLGVRAQLHNLSTQEILRELATTSCTSRY